MIIRHSSSFFISLLFHALLVVLILLGWKNIPSLKKEPKKVSVKLSCVVEKRAVVKKISKPKRVVKKIKHKPKPKSKPKKVKKVIKQVPVVMPVKKKKIIKPKPEVKEEIQKEPEPKSVPQVKEEIVASTQIQEKVQEDPHAIQEQILKEYLQTNITKIRQLIKDNLYYPRSARRRGKVGEVIVKFRLLKDATVEDIEVISSKSEILSRAAKKTIINISGDFPKPKEELIIKVPIDYQLKR